MTARMIADPARSSDLESLFAETLVSGPGITPLFSGEREPGLSFSDALKSIVTLYTRQANQVSCLADENAALRNQLKVDGDHIKSFTSPHEPASPSVLRSSAAVDCHRPEIFTSRFDLAEHPSKVNDPDAPTNGLQTLSIDGNAIPANCNSKRVAIPHSLRRSGRPGPPNALDLEHCWLVLRHSMVLYLGWKI